MEPLFFENFEVNAEYLTAARTVTETDVVAFAGLSGDFNPLHTDEEFAKQGMFGARIAHGMLMASITSGLVNQTGILHRTAVALLGFSCMFKAPVKFGDTISVRLRVIEKREGQSPDGGVVRLAAFVTNQRRELVLDGEFLLLMKKRG
jgi:acyl dehydratase